MIARFILVLGILFAVIGGIGYYKYSTIMKAAAAHGQMQMPPVTVSAMEAKKEVWRPSYQAIGSVEAVQGVTLSTEVSGRVTEILFDSGATIKAGTPLVKLDSSTEEADWKRLEADADLKEVQLTRARELLQKRANSQADLDTAEAEMKKADAAAASVRATIEKKTIRAPFDGQLGIRQVNLGQQLETGAPIVWIQTVDPIYVNFALPQQRLGSITNGQKVKVSSDAYPDTPFEGTLTTVNPKVDDTTRNVRLQASLENHEGKLRPGMYVSVQLDLPGESELVTIPITAVSYNPYGNFVYLLSEVKDEKTGQAHLEAKNTPVKLGDRRGDQVAVLSGVEPGQTVVTSGQIKIHPGSHIMVNNAITPPNDPSPKPADT